MTSDVAQTPDRVRKTRPRRKTLVLLAVAVLLASLAGYLYRYGTCEARSEFCVVDIAGTRSEVGFEWDSWSVYVSTWPNG